MLAVTIVLAYLAVLAFACAAKTAELRHHPSPTVAQLNHGLAGTPLAGYGATLDAAGKRWNVSPFLLAAIAGVESSFGAAACAGNAWGVASCNVTFPSFTAGVWYVARLLRTGYIGRGLTNPWSIGAVYCGQSCGSRWGTNVAWFIQSRFHAALTVTYPR